NLINNITISVPGGTFGDLILNPFKGNGSAVLTAITNEPGGGSATSNFTYSLDSLGQNFVTITTTGGETLASLTINSVGGFQELDQPRISLASGTLPGGGPGGGNVPEPSSLSLVAIGAFMMAGYARRRRQGVPLD